jgi:2,4-dienoyl-CoA reductase-like NADH-dependent reductase (Old Yellow Enzyme family)
MTTLPTNSNQYLVGEKNAKNELSLFDTITLRGISLRNRIAVASMCQYSAEDGFANDWHLIHLGKFASGGAALVLTEATAVEKRGRISPQDLGIYCDEHIEMLSKITAFIRSQGAQAGIQLAHAGRKGSTYRPWANATGEVAEGDGRWQTIGPSAIRFAEDYPLPLEMSEADIDEVVQAFVRGAERALKAGFQVIEIHAAHGYLIHEFLSPISNQRTDKYGGILENRMRFLIEVTDSIRAIIPDDMPLLVRVSATDWTEGGLDIGESIEIARALKNHGVDLIDVSTGGNVSKVQIPLAPNYQVPFAEAIKREAKIVASAVGLITEPEQANDIIRKEQADMIFLARALLRDPNWPLHAAQELKVDVPWPHQYERAKA